MNTQRVAICVGFVLACSAGVVIAQAPEAIVSRDVGFFDPGVDPAMGGQPRMTVNYLAVNATCGLPKVLPPAVTINPTQIRVDDPADATKDCLPTQSGSTLPSVPIGQGYRTAARARGATLISGWSALGNPFAVAASPPVVPTGVRAL